MSSKNVDDYKLSDTQKSKKELRSRIIAERSRISEVRARLYSDFISDALTGIAAKYDVVCSYAAFRGEVDLGRLHDRIVSEGKALLLPRVESKRMVFYEVKNLNELVKSKMGILEPDPEHSKRWTDEEIWDSDPLVITPGVVFSKSGARIGYGGGFYDRFFENSCGRGHRVGVCYRMQIFEELPVEQHDLFVDELVYAPQKVVLGLSGGVDSAVAAHMLSERGYEVVGLWLGMWKKIENNPAAISAEQDDARRVADRLGIEFVALDRSKEFRETVIDYFVREYLAGRTPNPCVHCNRQMKFKSLIDYADSIGAEYIATGHYANVVKNDGGRYEVHLPRDGRKDQSYMLSRLTQEQLGRVLMPLAEVENKAEVRRIAAELGFHISEKKDSQEICFVEDSYLDFLNSVGAKGRSGSFVLDGERIREHGGIENYTIGQRRGLGAFGRPVFVVDINAESGDVILGENKDLFGVSLEAGALNYVALPDGAEIGCCTAKIRYAAPMCACRVELLGGGRVRVDFDEPQRAITPGQSVVFYREGVVLASAIIEKKLV